MNPKVKFLFKHIATFLAGLGVAGIPVLTHHFISKNSIKLMHKEEDLSNWLEKLERENNGIFNFGEDADQDGILMKCGENYEKYEMRSKANGEYEYEICLSKKNTKKDLEGILGEQFENFIKVN